MLTNIKRNSEGFTIVETLIVLAIAGLIILIVLLAVPALQRSSRNSNMKSDASALQSAITEYESNNGGTIPTLAYFPATPSATGQYNVGQTGASPTDASAQAKLQPSDTVKSYAAAAVPTYSTSAMKDGQIDVVIGETCNLQASTRSVAVFYPVLVTGSSTGLAPANANDCLDS